MFNDPTSRAPGAYRRRDPKRGCSSELRARLVLVSPLERPTKHVKRSVEQVVRSMERVVASVERALRPIKIVPSVLPADFANLGEACRDLEEAGVDHIQWDVMDGNFVPNLTFGPDVIAACRSHVEIPFEAHLMVEDPALLAERYVEAGCSRLIVHAETTRHLHRTLGAIGEMGATAAVAINPATPASAVAHVLDLVDMVLVMTVNPGFGGQRYIASMEPKIVQVAELIDASGFDVDIEVDGGISKDTIQGAARAGANVLVAGSALFADPEGLTHAVSELRTLAEGAR